MLLIIKMTKIFLILMIFWTTKWHSSLRHLPCKNEQYCIPSKTTEHNKNQTAESSTLMLRLSHQNRHDQSQQNPKKKKKSPFGRRSIKLVGRATKVRKRVVSTRWEGWEEPKAHLLHKNH